MRRQALFRSVLDVRRNNVNASQLPPIFLAPQLAHLNQNSKPRQNSHSTSKDAPQCYRLLSTQASTQPSRATTTLPPTLRRPSSQLSKQPDPLLNDSSSSLPPLSTPMIPSVPVRSTTISAPTSPDNISTPLNLSRDLRTQLPHLSSLPAGSLYIRIHIHRTPFLLTPGDTLRLPFLLQSVQPGDILRLNRATLIGSRDYTLKPGFENIPPGHHMLSGSGVERSDKKTRYIDERLFECRARVIATESMPMQVKEKTKRRQRHVRQVKSKLRYTVLRCMEVRVKSHEELGAEAEDEIRGGQE